MGGYKPAVTEEEKILQRRVSDAVKSVGFQNGSRVLGFMNERQQQLAVAQLNSLHWHSYSMQGGYAEAQRKMLCVYSEEEPEIPLSVLRVTPQETIKELTHRDYLGSVLATGIKRECVGDILVGEQFATIFVQTTMLQYIIDELDSIGRTKVKVCEVTFNNETDIEQREPLRLTASVSSLRLDAVLAAMLQNSRTQATALVQKGLVQVNHLQTMVPHTPVCEKDIFSIKGVGRFQLDAVGGKSRKKRTFIEFLKF